ncbi:MAG: exosortase/archaeosortase family protein, partial [Myxococcales bacterium]|nr:exosortase/archaeosortase family protein [Myxococcales bacterium]
MQLAQLAYLALAAFAYRALLVSSSQAGLSRELEEWFFIPTETSPLVVVLLAAWLVYRRRERLVAAMAEPAAWPAGIALLGAGLVAFAWAMRTATPHLLAVSLACVGVGAAAVHCGTKGARLVALPALLLVFAIPIPAPLLAEVVYRFQLWTADYAGWLLFALGRSAYVSGDQILLAGDHFAVIEGCSGLRSVQTLTMVALLLVELFGRRGLHALAILVLAPLVAFALNGFRVLALILNPHSEVVAIHNLQGVAILLGGLAILYAVDGGLERLLGDGDAEPVPQASLPA